MRITRTIRLRSTDQRERWEAAAKAQDKTLNLWINDELDRASEYDVPSPFRRTKIGQSDDESPFHDPPLERTTRE